MAIEYDISGLGNKISDEGSSAQGRLTHDEWNLLIDAVEEVQTKVEGTMKGIKYNGIQTFDEIDEDGYLNMIVADTSGYELAWTLTKPPTFMARGSECPLSVEVSSKKVVDGGYEPASAACIVNVYINGVLVNSGQVYDKEYGNPDNKDWYDASKNVLYTFDLATAKAASLAVGTPNEIMVEVNNRFGKVQQDYCEVNVIELGLQVQSFGEVNVFTETNKPNILAVVSGSNGTINAKVDGQTIVSNYPANAGETQNLGTDYFNGVNTHGVHTLEIWASVNKTVGGVDFEISTQPQVFTYIYGTSLPQPIVMANISNTKPEEYSTLNVSYVAYKYNNTAVAVKDTVSVGIVQHGGYDEDGNVIPGDALGEPQSSEITFDVATNSGQGTAGISLFPVTIDGKETSLVGKKLIKLTIGKEEDGDVFTQYTEIEVLKSSVTLSQLGGYAVYLTSAGRNNKQGDKREWISKDGKDAEGKKLVVSTTFDDDIEFLDTGSGWIPDSDGNVAMHLNRGKYFTLEYQPFATNPTYNDQTNNGTGRGKTISFELATRNCLKNNSVVVDCMDDANGAERGFQITASQAILKSNNFGLQAKFRENVRIKIDFVIEGIQNEYTYTTIAGKDATEDDWETGKTSREALCIIYVDGVYQALKVIPNGTTFLQGRTGSPAKTIRFGSEDCDLDIYNIRIYDQALTPAQIVNNYAYDTPKYEEKLAIAKRNDIFDATSIGNKPNINIEKLRKARPELPFWFFKMEVDADGNEVKVPYDKTNWKKNPITEWKNPANEDNKIGNAITFTSEKGQLRNQGTSSMTYPWPWRNWDWKTKEFVFPDGTKGDRWCQYLGMMDTEGLQKITLKKDYASSEMCNNAITSEFFTDMALGAGSQSGFENVMSPAMRAQGASTPYRLTFKAVPCFMFQEFNDPNKQGTAGKGYDALGMMNLIPNKNECGYLGFMGDYVWDPEEDPLKRAQSWELADNMDDWFWYKKINPISIETGVDDEGNPYSKIVNECIECYEARYPKDSTLNERLWNSDKDEADFGSTPKGYTDLNEEQIDAINDEQADIIEFHNWLVDCNRQIPVDYYAANGKYRELSSDEYQWDWNMKDGEYNKLDTPDYRLKKFIAEAPTRLIVDQFCLYYIWRETFHAFDSGFKNLQVYTMGKANEDCAYQQWGCMVRDADTTLGIENTGKDIFPAHLEDIDYFTADEDADGNAVSNVKFVYGGANGMYHASSIDKLGGNPILNGQLGTLWINLRDGFRSRIGEVYRALKNSTSAKWNASGAIKRFRDHQEKWCENLYNFGMRQYFGGAPFTKWIESGLGDKKNSRASWLERGFYYRDSKYLAVSDLCTVRAVTYETPDFPDGNTAKQKLQMKAYIPMYFLTGASTEDPSTCTSVTRVTDTDGTFGINIGQGGIALPNTGDQNRWFWGTSMLTEIGDLARVCKVKMFQKLDLPKVRNFSLGHEKARDGKEYKEYYYQEIDGVSTRFERPIQNDELASIAVDSLKSMSIFDITNHKKLSAIEGLAECKQLQEFYAKGTDSLRALTLPATTALKTLYLGKSLTQLDLTELTGLEHVELEGADAMQKLFIRNCGSYMAARSYDIALQVLPSLEAVYDAEYNNNVCQLTGIKWDNCSVSDLERLYNINAQLAGEITITGDESLTNDLKVKLVNKYGDIDNPDNELRINYSQLAIREIVMPNKMYIFEEGQHQMTFTANPLASNTYASAEWTLTGASTYAEIDPTTGIITRNNVVAPESSAPAQLKVKVYQIPDRNGVARQPVESKVVQVYFYERHAKPGDIVYHDGSFTDEIDKSKTPVGVCFYVDPENKDNRLMVALENISQNEQNIGQYKWGIGTGSTYTSNGELKYQGSPVINPANLGYDSMASIIDVPMIDNALSHGGDPTLQQMFTDDAYRSQTTADKFKDFDFRSCMGNLGFNTANNDVVVNYEKVVEKDKTYPIGYMYTMSMIKRRDEMVEYFSFLNITGTVGKTSEYVNLFTDINNAAAYKNDTWGANWDTYLYPAASLCYAYEPGGEGKIIGLNNKFKKHNWFIPASGDMARICYYMRQYYVKDSEYAGADAFALAIDNGILKKTGLLTAENSGVEMLTSTEYGTKGENCVTVVSTGYSVKDSASGNFTGICRSKNKYDQIRLRAICRF